MAKPFAAIEEPHREFIAAQKVFFVASAAPGARVNLSPRPTDCLRVLGPNRVAYRDLTGSGSETAAHLKADGRLTMMFCAFEGRPLILRLYGRGQSFEIGTPDFEARITRDFGDEVPLGTRQIVELEVGLVQTSCGYGVPLFTYEGERENLQRWAENKGEEGLLSYRREKNSVSIDGLPSLAVLPASKGE